MASPGEPAPTRDPAPLSPSAARRYDPVAPREERILRLARTELRPELAQVEEVLAVYLDLLGAVEEEYRMSWPAEESRLGFLACLLRLFDDLLATDYLTQRGLYLQANRLWQDFLETLWLGLYFVREPAAAGRWLRGGRQSPKGARRALEAQGQLLPESADLYDLLERRANPQTKAGFERSLTISQQMGEWHVSFFVGGEGNVAWLRRGLLDWLFVATYGLEEIGRLGIAAPESQWAHRRAAAVGAAQRLLSSTPRE
ncbi:MAG TPA: hypothetical protein VK066_23250 [Chloroflexota bacterium]|nr:hypothetical protein [Chloroflexota bacterium]